MKIETQIGFMFTNNDDFDELLRTKGIDCFTVLTDNCDDIVVLRYNQDYYQIESKEDFEEVGLPNEDWKDTLWSYISNYMGSVQKIKAYLDKASIHIEHNTGDINIS